MLNYFKFLVFVLFLFSIQNSFSDEFAIDSSLVKQSLLLQADQYDSLTVVVGERGHILYSNEKNQDWIQATVETNVTLTGVFMFDEMTGWAVGHDAVILKTIDGARTWKKMFSDVNEEAPLLDIIFTDELNGIAIGAYSLVYVTEDGGSSWTKKELNFSSIEDNESSGFMDVMDFHLNAITFAGKDRFYLAAEAGHILRSDDAAKSWIDLPSPYHGSFFGILPLSQDEVLAFGLRGHLYHSLDAGNTWKKIETGTKQMLTDAVVLSNGDIIVVGLAGTLLLSKDKGNTFASVDLKHRHGLSAIVQKHNDSIVLSSDAGIKILTADSLLVTE